MGITEENQPFPEESTVAAGIERSSQAGNAPIQWPMNIGRSGVRLPTEAEWEVACRAGVRTQFAHGSDDTLLIEYAWGGLNAGKDIHLPKTRKPNLRGLFDMHGNLFEWTYDFRGKYPTGEPQADYMNGTTGKVRVMRGGCWGVVPYLSRSSFRMGTAPDFSFIFMGLRPVMTLPDDAASKVELTQN